MSERVSDKRLAAMRLSVEGIADGGLAPCEAGVIRDLVDDLRDARERLARAEADAAALREHLRTIIYACPLSWSDTEDPHFVAAFVDAKAAASSTAPGSAIMEIAQAARAMIGNGGCVGYMSPVTGKRVVEVAEDDWFALHSAVAREREGKP